MKLSSQFDHDPAYTRFARQSGLRAADFEPPSRRSARALLAVAIVVCAGVIFAVAYGVLFVSHLLWRFL